MLLVSRAKHERLRAPFQLGLIIIGEVSKRISHLLIVKQTRKAPAAPYLFDEVDRFLFHGHRQCPRQPHAQLANVDLESEVPFGAGP